MYTLLKPQAKASKPTNITVYMLIKQLDSKSMPLKVLHTILHSQAVQYPSKVDYTFVCVENCMLNSERHACYQCLCYVTGIGHERPTRSCVC